MEEKEKIYQRKYYQENKEKILNKNKRTRNRLKINHPEIYTFRNKDKHNKGRARNIQRVIEYKKSHPCILCGETNPVVLVFHHKNESEKLFGIAARASSTNSWGKTGTEIEKCVVLCCNCHAIIHNQIRLCKRNGTQFSLDDMIKAKEISYQI